MEPKFGPPAVLEFAVSDCNGGTNQQWTLKYDNPVTSKDSRLWRIAVSHGMNPYPTK